MYLIILYSDTGSRLTDKLTEERITLSVLHFYFMCMSVMATCVSDYHVSIMCSACGGQKRVLMLWELELQIVVSCHMVVGTMSSLLQE